MVYPKSGYTTSFYTLSFSHSISHSICLRKRHFLFFSHNCNTTFSGCGVADFIFVFSVRISSLLRTLLSKSGEFRGKFCLIIIFRYFLKLLIHLQELLNPHLQKGVYIAPELYPCNYYFVAQ